MTLDRWITSADPDRTALIFGDEALTYGAFANRIVARAEGLARAGISHGDRVAWYGMNHAEVFVLLFACARIGAILVPLNWRLAESEIAAIVEDAAPSVVLHDDHFAAAARRLGAVDVKHWAAPLPVGCRAASAGATLDDTLLLVYTSGSTGRPKGVLLAQQALVANARMSIDAHGLTPSSRVLNVLPLFHVGGLNILPTPAFSLGATVILHEKFDPDAACAALGVVSHAIVVPTVLQAIMERPGWSDLDLSQLKAMSIGSTDVPLDLIEAVQTRGVPVCQIYGATETAPFAIYQRWDEAFSTSGSIGRAGSACKVRLVRDEQDVPDGSPGEIWVKGENVFQGYWRDPALSAEALTDGWFHTGDVAKRDAKGLYWFTDRIKHVIISGGENIYPAEIERILRETPGIEEVAVVGRRHDRWGEVPVAVVVGSLSREEVLSALDGKIARYKRPHDVMFVDALPRNTMGKVVAAEVRAML